MTLVEQLSLELTDEQREQFILLVVANPDASVFDLFYQVINHREP